MRATQYPNIKVNLADLHLKIKSHYIFIGRVMKAMHREGLPAQECARFQTEALLLHYDELLLLTREWVTIEGDDENN